MRCKRESLFTASTLMRCERTLVIANWQCAAKEIVKRIECKRRKRSLIGECKVHNANIFGKVDVSLTCDCLWHDDMVEGAKERIAKKKSGEYTEDEKNEAIEMLH